MARPEVLTEEVLAVAETIWPTIHAERQALIDDLTGLRPEQWQARSLAQPWTVHDVLAHLVAAARMTPLRFFPGLAGVGFDFHRFMDKLVARERAGGPEATLASFRAVRLRTSSPPAPPTTWLGEAFVHGEDIRRPLGIAHSYPLPQVVRVIRYYARLNALLGARRRIAGVTLTASDTDFSLGSGPVVEGPAISLLMATAGRKAVLDDLTGPGVRLLRERP
ncbi:MAG: maleylpyruvate isomerase family mycothiol-dependent enzyme [Actinobacteria bacterium]|nr:maleylpyruvate isomerase family mycothiol-dependent enzyme [Actinomycetota bacterium]